MKIIQFADYFNNLTGNPLAIFTEKLQKRGHSVTVFSSNVQEKTFPSKDKEAKAKILRFRGCRFGHKTIFPGVIFELLRTNDNCVVHAHVLGFFSIFIAGYLKVFKRFKLVVTPDFDILSPRPGFFKRLFNYFFVKLPASKADRIIPFTEKEKSYLHQIFGFPLKQMTVVPIGINYNSFQGKTHTDWRKKLGLENKFIILNVNFLYPKKNLEMALESLKKINSKNVILLHVGGCPVREYKEKLDRLVKEFGLQDKVIFIGDKSVNEIIDFYKIADIFINTGFRESYCIPLLEAMAAGLPVITTNVGVAEDIVSHGKTGYLIENANELKGRIETLEKNRQLRQKISQSGKLKAKAYDWEKIISKLENIYQEVLTS